MYNFESQWRFLLFELFTFISNSLKKNKSHKSQILSNYNAHWRWKNIKVSSRRQINKIIISGLCLVLNYSWRKLEVVKVILKYPIWQKSIDIAVFSIFVKFIYSDSKNNWFFYWGRDCMVKINEIMKNISHEVINIEH